MMERKVDMKYEDVVKVNNTSFMTIIPKKFIPEGMPLIKGSKIEVTIRLLE